MYKSSPKQFQDLFFFQRSPFKSLYRGEDTRRFYCQTALPAAVCAAVRHLTKNRCPGQRRCVWRWQPVRTNLFPLLLGTGEHRGKSETERDPVRRTALLPGRAVTRQEDRCPRGTCGSALTDLDAIVSGAQFGGPLRDRSR